MERNETLLPGVLLLTLAASSDARGSFLKYFSAPLQNTLPHSFEVHEAYQSTSKKNVLRGMHFQTPPFAHQKIVFCPYGRALDVVIDLRLSSPTFRRYVAVELGGPLQQAIHVPVGCAHGFLSLEEDTVMSYLVTSDYEPVADRGIAWNSFGFTWPVAKPVLSDRDQSFPALADFESSFP